MIEYKRPMPLDEPFPLDFFDLPTYEDVQVEDEQTGEIRTEQKLVDVWTAEEQYEEALAEWQAAKANPKFTVSRLGVDANDPSVPEHWRAYNQEGQVVGVNLGAQVGDLLAVVKAQQAAIEALQAEVQNLKARVSKLEGGKTP